MFQVLSTPIIRSTLNCIYSLWYRSYYRCSYLLQMWPNLAMLEEGSCNDNMTCTVGCRYSLMYSWWWVWKAPVTCRATLQWNKIDCEQLYLVGLLQYRFGRHVSLEHKNTIFFFEEWKTCAYHVSTMLYWTEYADLLRHCKAANIN